MLGEKAEQPNQSLVNVINFVYPGNARYSDSDRMSYWGFAIKIDGQSVGSGSLDLGFNFTAQVTPGRHILRFHWSYTRYAHDTKTVLRERGCSTQIVFNHSGAPGTVIHFGFDGNFLITFSTPSESITVIESRKDGMTGCLVLIAVVGALAGSALMTLL